MVDKTYREARIDNELVVSNPVGNQELINNDDVIGVTAAISDKDSGIRFSSLREWVVTTHPFGVMVKSIYDPDDNGIVNASASLDDGAGKAKLAGEVVDHIDSIAIHHALNDLLITTTNLWSASKIDGELEVKANQSALTGHTGNYLNPHQVKHAQLTDGGANAHTVIDAHLAITSGNPHGVTHAILPDKGTNSHIQIDDHLGSTGNPHGVTHAQVSSGDKYNHSLIDAHIDSDTNPHGVTAAQVNAAPDTHPGDTSHLTVAERQAMDSVSQALGLTNPFATMADIPPASGHNIWEEDILQLTQRPNLRFFGPTVTAVDNPGASATDVTIEASGNVGGPGSSVDGNLVAWDGAGGNLLKDANYKMPIGGAIGQVLGKASPGNYDWAWIDQDTGTGEINQAANVGTGEGNVWKDKVGEVLNFKTLLGFGNINITDSVNEIIIATAAEANDGNSLGTGQGEVFKDKTSTNLNFRSLRQGSNVTITQDANEITISADGGGGGSLTDAEFLTYAVFDSKVGAVAAVDFASGNKQEINATIHPNITLTSPTGHPANFVLRILNSNSLVSIAPAGGGNIRWSEDTPPSWNGTTTLYLYYDGTDWEGSVNLNLGAAA